MLGYIIGQKGKVPYKVVEPLLDVEFLPDNRAYIEDTDHRFFMVDAARIVSADFTAAIANIGTCYRLPIESISFLLSNEIIGG